MNLDWNLLLQAKDPGMAFQAGFETVRQRQMQAQQQNALLQQRQIQLQERQEDRQLQRDKLAQEAAEGQRQQQAERLERLAPLYAKVRNLPYEQRRAFIQQAMPTLRQLGVPDDMVAAYDPTDERLDADLAVIGQQKQTAGPNIQKEVEYYRSIGRPEMAEQLLARHAEGAPIVFDVTGDGAPDIVPRSYFNRPGSRSNSASTDDIPTVATPEEAKRLPPGTQFKTPDGRLKRVPGGQTVTPSGPFRP